MVIYTKKKVQILFIFYTLKMSIASLMTMLQCD